MADKIVSIKITSDGRAFVADQSANAAAVAGFDKELKSVGSDLDAFVAKTTAAGKKTADAATNVTKSAAAASQAGKTLKSAGDAADKSGKQLKDLGDKAALTTSQMQGLMHSARGTIDMILAGANPTKALAIEGARLAGTFGGVMPAVRAVGGALAGLINPATLTVAAIAAVAYGAYSAAEQEKELRQQLLLSGNAAGVTASQYKEMAGAIASVSATKGAALDALLQMAAGGNVAAGNLQRFTLLALQLDRTVGKPLQETAQEFEALGRTPVEASQKLNQAYNYLTASTYLQIKALQDQGETTKAATLAQNAYFDAMSSRMPEAERNLTTLDRLWKSVWNAIKGAGGAVADAFKTPSVDAQIAKVQQQIALASADPSKAGGWAVASAQANLAANQKLLQQLQQQKALEEGNAKASAQRAESTKAAELYAAQGNSYMPARVRMEQEVSKAIREGLAAGVSYAEIMERVKQIKKQIVDQDAKDAAQIRQAAIQAQGEIEAGQIKENVDRMTQLYKLGAVSEAEYIDMVGAAEVKLLQDDKVRLEQRLAIARTQQNSEREVADLKQQIALKDEAIDARKRKIDQDQIARYENLTLAVRKFIDAQAEQDQQDTRQAEADAYSRYMDAMQAVNEYRKGLLDQNKELQFQIGLLGKTSLEQQRLNELHRIDLQMQKQLDDLQKRAQGGKLTADQVAAEETRIRSAAADAAAQVDTKIWVDTWRQANQEVGEDLYLALTGRGAEARDRIKQLFERLVLKPLLEPVLNGISGSITNMLVGSMSGGGGGGAASMMPSLFSTAATTAGGGGLATMFGGGAASTAGAGGGIMAGLASIPVAGWIALGAMADYKAGKSLGLSTFNTLGIEASLPGALLTTSLLESAGVIQKPGGPKTESGYGYNVETRRGDPAGAKQIADMLQADYAARAAAIGVDPNLANVGVYYAQDPKGTAKTQLQINAGSYSRSPDWSRATFENVGRSQADFEAAVKLSAAQAEVKNLQDVATGAVGDFLKTINVTTASIDELTKSLDMATEVGSLDKALRGFPFTDIINLSVQAQEKLIGFSGGLQTLTQNLASYEQNFFSKDEQRAAAVEAMNQQLATVGLSLNGIDASSDNARLQFRHLVDSIDVTTEAGQKQRAMLYSIAPEFASVTKEIGDLGQGSSDVAQQVADAAKAMRDAGDSIMDTLRQLAGTNAGSGNLIDQYQAQKKQLQDLTAQALGGDAKAASQLGQAAKSFLDLARMRDTASGFTADDIMVRQMLARAMAVTGTSAAPGTASQPSQASVTNPFAGAVDIRPVNKTSVLPGLQAIADGAGLAASGYTGQDVPPEIVQQAADIIAKFTGSAPAQSGGSMPRFMVRAFATGTNYVTDDGPAILHEGEAVIPKRFNPFAFSKALSATSDPALRSEVIALRRDVAAAMQSIAVSNSRMASFFKRVEAKEGDAINMRQVENTVFATRAA